MPNWIQGSLKVRGSYDNVKNFFVKGLNAYRGNEMLDKKDWVLDIDEYNEPGEREFSMDIKPDTWVYVEDTRRAFVTSNHICFYEGAYKENPSLVVAACEINQAWCFEEDDWASISKEYNVDIRLWGLEQGVQFGQEIEIIDGEVIKNEEFKYDDWDWDCPLPWFGG